MPTIGGKARDKNLRVYAFRQFAAAIERFTRKGDIETLKAALRDHGPEVLAVPSVQQQLLAWWMKLLTTPPGSYDAAAQGARRGLLSIGLGLTGRTRPRGRPRRPQPVSIRRPYRIILNRIRRARMAYRQFPGRPHEEIFAELNFPEKWVDNLRLGNRAVHPMKDRPRDVAIAILILETGWSARQVRASIKTIR